MHGICFLILLTGGPCKSMIYSFKLACAGSGVPILHRLLDDSRRPCAVKFSSSLNIVNMKLLRFGPVVNRHKNTCRRLNAIKLFFWFSSFFCFFFWLNQFLFGFSLFFRLFSLFFCFFFSRFGFHDFLLFGGWWGWCSTAVGVRRQVAAQNLTTTYHYIIMCFPNYESRILFGVFGSSRQLETNGRPEIWLLHLMRFRNYESRSFRQTVENKFLVKPKILKIFGLTEKKQ